MGTSSATRQTDTVDYDAMTWPRMQLAVHQTDKGGGEFGSVRVISETRLHEAWFLCCGRRYDGCFVGKRVQQGCLEL